MVRGGPAVAVAVALVVLLAAGAAPVGAQQSDAPGGSTLRRARLRVVVESPTRARVEAALELAGSDGAELLLTSFAGQRIDWVAAETDGGRFEPRDVGGDGAAVHRVRVPGGDGVTGSVYLTYDVSVPEGRAYRFPLPVPQVPADPAGHTVLVEVELPAGMRYTGDGFPGFDEVSTAGARELLRARTVGVPSFVHVVFDEDGGGWPMPLRLQAGALGLVLLPLIAFWLHRRRRQAP